MQCIKRITTAFIVFLLFMNFTQAQPAFPDAVLKAMKGSAMASFASITAKDSLVLLCFWSTASEQSISQLNAINAQYAKWKEAAVFKMMAVAVDEGKSASRVRPTYNMNGWTFDVYIDINGDFKAAMHVNNLPEAMIVKSGKVIYQQSGYTQGTEQYLIEKIRLYSGKKN